MVMVVVRNLLYATIVPFPADPRCVCVIPDDHSNQQLGASLLQLPGSRTGRIETNGDRDYFRITVAQRGTLTVYSTGSFPVDGLLVTRDTVRNGAPVGTDFRIDEPDALGTYYVFVRARFPGGTGNYTVHAQLDVRPANRAPVARGNLPTRSLIVGGRDTQDVSGFL